MSSDHTLYHDAVQVNSMTNLALTNVGKLRGRWRVLAAERCATIVQKGFLSPSLLRTEGVMISDTYVVVSIYGVGIHGRLYGPGLHKNKRFLLICAYDPSSSQTLELQLSMKDLEVLFKQRPEVLGPGRKPEICHAVIHLLFFEYQEIKQQQQEQLPTPPQSQSRGEEYDEMVRVPVKLCISPLPQLNGVMRRLKKREEQNRLEELARRQALDMLRRTPKRARYRRVCQPLQLLGFRVIVSVYHLPVQAQNFTVVAYHPPTCQTFYLSVGVLHVAALSQIYLLPSKWPPELDVQIAKSMVPHIRLVQEGHRMALCFLDHVGSFYKGLGHLPNQTRDQLQVEAFEQSQRAAKISLHQKFANDVQALEIKLQAFGKELQAQTEELDASQHLLKLQDDTLKEKLEEIDGGRASFVMPTNGSTSTLLASKQPPTTTTTTDAAAMQSVLDHAQELFNATKRENRKNLKAERSRIKDQLKSLNVKKQQLTNDWKSFVENHRIEKDRLQQELTRNLDNFQQELDCAVKQIAAREAGVSGGSQLECTTTQSKRFLTTAMTRKSTQPLESMHRRLFKCWIDPKLVYVASGVCQIEHSVDDLTGVNGPRNRNRIRHRYSVFQGGDDPEQLVIRFYNPCDSRVNELTLSRLVFLSLTKQKAENQLTIPLLRVATSEIVSRFAALDQEINTLVQKLRANNNKKKTKNLQTRLNKICKLYLERASKLQLVCWDPVIQSLSDRIRIGGSSLQLDVRLFTSVVPIISIAVDFTQAETKGEASPTSKPPQPDNSENESFVYCVVHVELRKSQLVFTVYDPLECTDWQLVYPESYELLDEFAGNSFFQQQIHFEVLCSSLLFFTNETTGKVDLRFEA